MNSRLAIGALLLPLALVALFNFRNQAYPRSDEAEYLMLAQDQLAVFRQRGMASGISSLYTLRLWKPSLHGPLAVPFLWLTGGDVRRTAAWLQTTLYALTLTFSFLALSLLLGPWRAAVGTWLLGLQPWLVETSHINRGQSSLLLFLSAAVFCLVRRREKRTVGYAVGAAAALALAAMTRPVETLLVAAPPFVWFSLRNWNRRAALMTAVCFAATLLLIVVDMPVVLRAVLYLVFAATSIWTASRMDNRAWTLSVVTFCLVAGGWFLGFFHSVYYWAFQGALATHMRNVWQRPPRDGLQFTARILSLLFGPLGATLLGLGLLRGRELTAKWRGYAGVAGVAMLPILLGAFSENGSFWFYFNAAYLGMLGLVVWALAPSGAFPRARLAVGLVLSLIYAHFAIDNLSPLRGDGRVRPLGGADPCAELVDELADRVRPQFPAEVSVLYYQGMPDRVVDTLDRYCMTLYSKQQGIPLSFRTHWHGDESETFEVLMERQNRLSRYLLIGPMGEYSRANPHIAMVHYAHRLEEASERGAIEKLGWKRLGTLPARGLDQTTGEVLLLENLTPP